MSKPMRRWQYRGKKKEYIQKDAIANILAKMTRWNITITMLQNALKRVSK